MVSPANASTKFPEFSYGHVFSDLMWVIVASIILFIKSDCFYIFKNMLSFISGLIVILLYLF